MRLKADVLCESAQITFLLKIAGDLGRKKVSRIKRH
jgi:hypothetical protein